MSFSGAGLQHLVVPSVGRAGRPCVRSGSVLYSPSIMTENRNASALPRGPWRGHWCELRRLLGVALLGALALALPCVACAQGAGPAPAVSKPVPSDYRVGLFEQLGTNMLDSLTGYNLILHGLAIGSTAALSASGADGAIQRWFWRGNAIVGDTVPAVALTAGWFTPLVIPGAIALTGLIADDSKAASAGVAVLQAVGINALFIQLLKFVTGRPLPVKDGLPGDDDGGLVSLQRSRDGSEWGLFGGGVAWPSGHTSSHMAVASSLVAFYDDEPWLPFVAYPLVALMGLAMIEGDHHWFSDVVAGGLMGHAIGWTVGRNLQRRYDAAHGKCSKDQDAVRIQPVASPDLWMLVLSFDPALIDPS